jgi:hypothetical protein
VERLVLAAAGTAARRRASAAAAREAARAADWPKLARLLGERRLLATLGPRLIELAGDASSRQFATAVASAVAETRRQAALVHLVGEQVRERLAAAGIRSSVLKGPELGERIYGEAGRRPSSDVDLLVDASDLHPAVAVVRQLGYGAPLDREREGGLPLLHFALVHEAGELPPVELHWRIHWYEREFAATRLLPPPGCRDRLPEPADELLALLLFYARDGFAGLKQATDIGAWWDSRGSDLAPGALDRAVAPFPALRPAVLAASRAAEAVVGLPAGDLIKDRLGVRTAAAARLANPLPASTEAQVFADMGLVDGLLAPAGDWRGFVSRQVLPPPTAMPRRPDGRPQTRHGHAARVLARYCLASPRLLRRC